MTVKSELLIVEWLNKGLCDLKIRINVHFSERN